MQGLSYRLTTSVSADGGYCFVDELILSINDNLFGTSEFTSEAKLVQSEARRLLARLDLQTLHPQFNILLLERKSVELFSLLHEACWETGDWPSAYTTNESPDPTIYVGLPMATEIFDSNELYAVLHQGMLNLVFKGADSLVRGALIAYDDYCEIWRTIFNDLAERIDCLNQVPPGSQPPSAIA